MNEDFLSELKGKKIMPPKGALLGIIAIAVVIGVLMLNPFVQVGAGERGVTDL